MGSKKNDYTIVESVINLGHNLGLSVVAEGVETNKVLHALKVLKCDYVQGYLISKPLQKSDFLKWMNQNQIQ